MILRSIVLFLLLLNLFFIPHVAIKESVREDDIYHHHLHHHVVRHNHNHGRSYMHRYDTENITLPFNTVNLTCFTDPDHYPGVLSEPEYLLQKYFNLTFQRPPYMREREIFYNYLKTGEISAMELRKYIAKFPAGSSINNLDSFYQQFPWEERMKNKVYAWTVDFHPSPAGCNFGIYETINVVLHAEVDHRPYCDYYGICRQRMNQIFNLGAYMAGFALDPDYSVLKRDFYEIYKNDSEFQRIDVFMCSHPAANCELFEKFGKSMILFFTTRLEFGRHDLNVPWRVREIGKWNAWGELELREHELIELIHRNYLKNKLFLVANNLYDAHYVHYFTGLMPKYIPSWCGDADNSWGLKGTWQGCLIDDHFYQPTSKDIVIVPYKQSLWMMKNGQPDSNHKLYQQLQEVKQSILLKYSHLTTETLPSVRHSLEAEIGNHRMEVYKQFPALVFIPYQTSVMSFFEYYRLNIPMFAPTLRLLVEWNAEYELIQGRIYGWPKRELDFIRNFSCHHLQDKKNDYFCSIEDENYQKFMNIPNPNSKAKELEANEYWLQFSDIYHFPHITYFDSFENLYEQILKTNLTEIHLKMIEENQRQRIQIAKDWDEIFQKAAPHRKRGYFDDNLHRFIANHEGDEENEQV